MIISCWSPKVAICAVLVIICLYPVGGLVLDLSHTSFPSCIDVFEGTFTGGGMYRMFHSNGARIAIVRYGDQALGLSKYLQ
ncbi:uncharacterized protein BXIN_0859 [Babesia sp. Xinjiang]|uniref:uncharacterized protein n=1 Tax=Babesia sp. Xinjiang TaxID=462227 RepID=UPI000A22C4D9|nr:uncharacterized protein BXIN_0859 [Babesia sp. Xinjiang]ORM41277.1 hypothetical protein BXIN_0859 [Babesia sp. Xinjiang]